MKPHLPQLFFDLARLSLRGAVQASFTLQGSAQSIQQVPPTHPTVDAHLTQYAGMLFPEFVPNGFI